MVASPSTDISSPGEVFGLAQLTAYRPASVSSSSKAPLRRPTARRAFLFTCLRDSFCVADRCKQPPPIPGRPVGQRPASHQVVCLEREVALPHASTTENVRLFLRDLHPLRLLASKHGAYSGIQAEPGGCSASFAIRGSQYAGHRAMKSWREHATSVFLSISSLPRGRLVCVTA
jgi:hypothetical protein